MDIISVALSKSYTNSVLNNLLQSGDLIKGEDGNGINKIEKINSENLIDTYRIYLDDNTTYDFAVTNGKDGLDGKSIISATIDSNNLFFGLSDGSTIPAGTITTLKGADGTTPTLTIGDVTTLDSDQQATVNITGTSQNPVLNFGIPKGKDANLSNITTTDEKVKLNSSSTAKYLEEWIDNKTITIDTVNNVIKAITLDGLETTIATLNYVKNLDKDIMLYLNSVSNPMTFKGVVTDDDALNAITDAQSGDTYIVQSSASNSGKTMTFVYNGTAFVPLAETTIEVRNFTLNPIDLSTEVTGILAEEKIDSAIARLATVLSKDIYGGSAEGIVKSADTLKELTYTIAELNTAISKSHEHLNKTTLDKIIENGLGNRVFTDNGTYKEFVVLSSTEPQDTYVLWVDTTSSTAPVLKIHDGTSWIAISGAGSSITISTADNNAIKNKLDGIYVEDKTQEIQELSDSVDTIKKYHKYVNTELDYCYCTLINAAHVPVVGTYIPWVKRCGNIDITDGKFTIKSGKTVKITCDIGFYQNDSAVYGSMQFNLLDITQNITISAYIPAQGYTTSEHPRTLSAIYTNDSVADIEIGVLTVAIWKTDTLSNNSYITVQEINRQITIDPVEYVNTTQGIEDTPVGYIIAHMGTTAPPHYLICDGSQVAVADYPYLAQHFIDEFGSEYYFGGSDGLMNLPDLRERFLKGSDNAGVNQVAGLPNITGYVQMHGAGTATAVASAYGAFAGVTKQSQYGAVTNKNGASSFDMFSLDASRSSSIYGKSSTVTPLNTSVLYCIKYEPTYFMQNIYTGNEEVVLWEGTHSINVSTQGTTALSDTISLIDSVINYDRIEIKWCRSYASTNAKSTHGIYPIDVSDIVFGDANSQILLNFIWDSIYSCSLGFDDEKTLGIHGVYTSKSQTNWVFEIYKIITMKLRLLSSQKSAKYPYQTKKG